MACVNGHFRPETVTSFMFYFDLGTELADVMGKVRDSDAGVRP